MKYLQHMYVNVLVYTYYYVTTVFKHIRDFTIEMSREHIMPYQVYKVTRCNKNICGMEQELSHEYREGVFSKLRLDEYIEYRVLFRGKKFRCLSTTEQFIEPCLTVLQKTKEINDPFKNPRIISAVMCNKFDNCEVDVFERVLKFAGPNHNFFNQILQTRWIFGDAIDQMNDENMLRIIYSNGIINTFSPNEHIKKF